MESWEPGSHNFCPLNTGNNKEVQGKSGDEQLSTENATKAGKKNLAARKTLAEQEP